MNTFHVPSQSELSLLLYRNQSTYKFLYLPKRETTVFSPHEKDNSQLNWFRVFLDSQNHQPPPQFGQSPLFCLSYHD